MINTDPYNYNYCQDDEDYERNNAIVDFSRHRICSCSPSCLRTRPSTLYPTCTRTRIMQHHLHSPGVSLSFLIINLEYAMAAMDERFHVRTNGNASHSQPRDLGPWAEFCAVSGYIRPPLCVSQFMTSALQIYALKCDLGRMAVVQANLQIACVIGAICDGSIFFKLHSLSFFVHFISIRQLPFITYHNTSQPPIRNTFSKKKIK